jgi:branched-chain amino acid transport system ATP-binding protein
MLELQGLRCGYGQMEAVHGIDLSVPAGGITALLGPNGAGKTSTMMAIVGRVAVFGGRILLDGQDITALPPAERTRLGVAIAPEGRRIFPDLTVAENLTVGGYTRSLVEARRAEARVLTLFPRLAERRMQRAGSMSGGEQQMLAIARALMAEPRLLLVDELSLGLMPAVVHLIFETLRELQRDGLTVLLVEQNIQRALREARHVAVLTAGHLAFSGTSDEAGRHPGFAELFLG